VLFRSYAKVSKKTKSIFRQFITDYFETREQLVCAFVLIDIRHEAQNIDIEFMSYMGESEIPFCIIFTKADKISKVKINSHIAAYKKQMFANNWAEMPHYFVTSATEMTGKMELLDYIDEVNQEVFNIGLDNYQIKNLAYMVREELPFPVEIDVAPDDADKRDYNVVFNKAKSQIGFEAKVGVTQGISEIYSALKSGKVDVGPKTVTVQWYRNILEAKSLLDSVLLDGRVI
jgi:hypothetical protein